MLLRSLRRGGFLAALVTGIAISIYSLQAINTTSSGSEFIPELELFDKQMISSVDKPLSKPTIGDYIGTLSIPRINRVIPIYEGTDDAVFKKGAGHYAKSVLPGFVNNSVIAGHRDSVFSKFGALKIGDSLTVTTSYGSYLYIVESFRIVKSDDRTVIVPTPTATLTLSTCYPFFFVGNAPKRFVVTAKLISEPYITKQISKA